ncbi:DUF2489 domain-containing protein [Amphritea sp. HPY]|uniref:DUF2489 domain-containing protein n=1 Tax=Amphritea sp. HPY TaxID=3421652 RepID=UPI003D7E4623
MSETTVYLLIAVNLFIVAGLAVYIFRLLRRQKLQRQAAEDKLKAVAEEVRKHRLYLIESLQVIGGSIINGEIPLTEASIRCKVLLDNLDPQLGQSDAYIVFNEVYQQSKHIPKLEAWKKLKSIEKAKHMQVMEQLESDYSERIRAAAKALRLQDFNHYR